MHLCCSQRVNSRVCSQARSKHDGCVCVLTSAVCVCVCVCLLSCISCVVRPAVLCPLLCKNGGVCLQKDRCLCPPNFTGKFCQLPLAATSTVAAAASPSSPNEIVKPALLIPMNQERTCVTCKKLWVLYMNLITLCSSPLPGLRSREMCCSGIGKAWGITDCVLCPDNTGTHTHTCMCGNPCVCLCVCVLMCVLMCVDVNECLRPGLCENGICVNTMGSYSCVCGAGFILDDNSSLSSCVSSAQSVISEEKGQCYRVLGSGQGPSSCSLPILRNITKQICCCSRVGKAWGTDCQRCPYFGSVAFKEICPAGPGYHSASGAGSRAGPPQPLPRPQPQAPSRPQPQPQPQAPSRPQAQPQPQAPSRPQAQPQAPSRPQAQPQPQTPSRPQPQPQPQTPSRPQPQPQAPSRPQAQPQPRLDVSPSFRPVQPGNVNECVQSPGVCSVGECVNTMGSYRCVCPPGYRSNSQQTSCQDVDECQQNPCSNGRCDNTPGSYRCVCRLGYRLSGNTCTDVDECAEPSQCPGQMCVNSVGSYRCMSCRPGYTLTNRQCTDVDECLQASQCPGQQCVNTVGSYRCVSCQPGYSSQDGSCQDVDECVSVGACEAERVCVNTVGSFRCDCRPGYRTAGLGRQCRDINECLEGEFCFPKGECVNTVGSYTCVCSQGYTLSDNRTACIDVDECVKAGVCVDGRCVNTEGSFQCQCEPGFTTNPERTACLDVDECVSSGGSVCGSQRCENTIGSYHCLTSCEPGYEATQADVNECSNQTVCGEHAFCQNLIGTYLCVCDQGFTSTADGKACVDEDECVSLPGVCGRARCENVEGSFMCECDRRGYEFDASSRQCVNTAQQEDVDLEEDEEDECELRECYYNLAERGACSLLATNTSQQECCCTVGEGWGLGCQYHTCPPTGSGEATSCLFVFLPDVDECKRFHPEVCKNGVCVNNIPGYNCYCSSGYVYNSTLLECVDHDECEEESCVGGICVNTVGSYYCSCQPPLVLDDTQRNCNMSVCWQHVTADLVCQSPLLGAQVTFMDCCCLYGEGWGMECALCPATDSDDYASLCSSFLPPLYPESFPDSAGPEAGVRPGAGRGGGGSYAGLSAAEDCGILHGCENGRCIRVAEGYTCDCYQGYELDMTSMTCTDVNECEDGAAQEFPCVNARCVNTDGSFSCVCRRGYVMSRRPNHCVAA
uniref:Latent-transforming growth factor beta-binding protein 4 n=1 Tax=Sparus aurata TaxID=8175 RepID=A0A671TUS3_SPAAU